MARWPFRRDEPDLVKATAQARYTATDVAAILQAAGTMTSGSRDNPLPRDVNDQVAFGPGTPLLPAAIDPRRTDTGRPEPRLFEYPVSWNLPGVADRMVPWKVLRDFADRVPIARRCIELRKAEVTSLDWMITVSKEAVNAALREDRDTSPADVQKKLRDQYQTDMVRCTQFLRTPDRGNGLEFVDWVQQLLEEHFVLDAIALYPRRTYNGDLYALEVLDGSTIKPLLDHRGGRPVPPFPAYQQILSGFPRGEFLASTENGPDGTVIPNGYLADQLIYRRRNVRTHTPYGFSATEQALIDGDLYLRRHGWMRAEYTDGVSGRLIEIPSAGMAADWTPGQLREWEDALNDLLSGDTAARRKFRVLPPGMVAAHDSGDGSAKYKPDYDLHLIKLLAGHYETTSTELGFAETSGLGGAGFHEGQSDVQDRKATRPTLAWLGSLLTSVLRTHLGMPPELEFTWHGLESEDEAAADLVLENRVRSGRMTLNDARDEVGRPRYDFAEADMPMLLTQRGLVFLEGSSESVQPGMMIGPAQATPGQDEQADQDSQGAAAPTRPAKPQQPTPAAPVQGKVDAAREGDDVPARSPYTVDGDATPVHLTTGVGFDQAHAIAHLDRALEVIDDLEPGQVKDALLFNLQHASRHADGARAHLHRLTEAMRRDPANAAEFDRIAALDASRAKAEMSALRRFIAKGDRTRPFTAAFLTRELVDAAGLDSGRVRFLAEADDARGRPEGRVAAVADRARQGQPAGVVVYRPGV